MRIIILMLSLITAVITVETIQGTGISPEKLTTLIIASIIFILCVVLEMRSNRKMQREIETGKENLRKLSNSFDKFLNATIQ